ncbi:unnamed protein product [Lactuca saligna]|uniref:Uncharacterized protein n=1 Tax=Lactuca saligna TaxID=75948 RepID=A0AA35Y9G5_LACSI|nr:unnamed protein product [Lactuca saligna]
MTIKDNILDAENLGIVDLKPAFEKRYLKDDDQIRLILESRAKNTTRSKRSLSDLGYNYKFRQATALKPEEVIRAIKALKYEGKIKGSNYYFSIPSRESVIYVKEYDQILLKEKLFRCSFRNLKMSHRATITSCILSIIS